MKDPDPPRAEIDQAARRVHELAPVVAVEPDREGVQGEVAAREILGERGGLDVRARRPAPGRIRGARSRGPPGARPGGATVAVWKTGCSRALRRGSLASARASVAALPSTTRSRSVRSSTRSSRRSRTRPPTAATGSPSVSPCAPAARRISPARSGSRSSSRARERGSPTGAPGSRKTTPSGPRGPPTRRKGRSGPRRCRTATSEAVGGSTGTSQRMAETGARPRPRAQGAAERLPRCGGPRRADAGDDEAARAWRSARRAAGATVRPGGTTTKRRCISPAARGSTCG